MEIAAQRAREETERFLLPESLVERVQARALEPNHDDDSSARKRKRPANGELDTSRSMVSACAYAALICASPATGEAAAQPVLQACHPVVQALWRIGF